MIIRFVLLSFFITFVHYTIQLLNSLSSKSIRFIDLCINLKVFTIGSYSTLTLFVDFQNDHKVNDPIKTKYFISLFVLILSNLN